MLPTQNFKEPKILIHRASIFKPNVQLVSKNERPLAPEAHNMPWDTVFSSYQLIS